MMFSRRGDEASCREVSRALQAYLDGHVDEVTARRVARHLEACRRCGLEAEVYTGIKEALSRMERDVASLPVAHLRELAPTGRRRGLPGPASHQRDEGGRSAGLTLCGRSTGVRFTTRYVPSHNRGGPVATDAERIQAAFDAARWRRRRAPSADVRSRTRMARRDDEPPVVATDPELTRP